MAEKSTTENNSGFTADEKAAMKARAAELRAEKARAKRADKDAADLQDCLDKIAAMPDEDRALAETVHRIILASAPELRAKTWYGMPAYTLEGKNVVFFQAASKFGVRYSTLGFEERAHLDDGDMWPTSYALRAVGPAEEKRITELVARAVTPLGD